MFMITITPTGVNQKRICKLVKQHKEVLIFWSMTVKIIDLSFTKSKEGEKKIRFINGIYIYWCKMRTHACLVQ